MPLAEQHGKTAVLITSRHHPEQLTATALLLARLAKRPQDLTICVWGDLDDGDTVTACGRLKLALWREHRVSCELLLGPRPHSLGWAINQLANCVQDAAYYHVLNDDVTPLTVGWDDIPFKESLAVSCWDLTHENPGCPDYPVVSRRWVEAAGQLFTEHFPFWFDDRWLVEVSALVHGGIAQALPMTLYTNKRGTQRIRELGFWFTYFLFLQGERIAQAQRVVDALGRDVKVWRDRADKIDFARTWHRDDCRDYLLALAGREAPGAPDPSYLRAKDLALRNLAVNPDRYEQVYDFLFGDWERQDLAPERLNLRAAAE